MKKFAVLTFATLLVAALPGLAPAPMYAQIAPFPLTETGLAISRPTQSNNPFTVAGPTGVVLGTQDGQFESWILPVKLLSHLTIEANIEGYTVPIDVNAQAANIEVRPDHTTITYSHIAFTLRQIMFSPDAGVPQVSNLRPGSDASQTPLTGPVVLFQIDCDHPMDLIFRFTPELRWMWPKRNDGIPGPDWIEYRAPAAKGTPAATDLTGTPQLPPLEPGLAADKSPRPGFYALHMDYPDLAGAVTIPTATPGVLAPYQERPQVHPLELRLHYDPKRDGQGAQAKYFPLLMAIGRSKEAASNEALGRALQELNASIPEAYKAHVAAYAKMQSETTTIETPDKALNEAFQWGVVSIEQLKARVPTFSDEAQTLKPEEALVAGYYQSADSARPGFGWFFGRDALYTLYAVNGFGDFALTRAELEFLITRQRADGKIMHEFSQTAGDPSVDWKSFPYMYAAADATPLFLMAMRDYYRASGDTAFLQAHQEAIKKAWAFETDPAHDTDHDGIYDNSQGTGWVESWPHDTMPHQEVYLALLDEQASRAYSELEQELTALGSASGISAPAKAARARAEKIAATIEAEYYDPAKGCYAFSYNPDRNGKHDPNNAPNSSADKSSTIYPAIAWWDDQTARLAHPDACLQQWAGPTIATGWGLRDVATTEPFYDGMSYHQGSVWPLFTGWGALAEYRANQPLAGEQMLMENVDLTWAQDPGAVTELLSGDYFVPFGRSTSHQLWSSSMVITPTLRGLFGISLDAATNTITVNPHLPAYWKNAEIHNIHLGGSSYMLNFTREHGALTVIANPAIGSSPATTPKLTLRSDVPGTKAIDSRSKSDPLPGARIAIPLPAIEPILPELALPTPGSRTSQLKVLSSTYGPNQVTMQLSGAPESEAILFLRENHQDSDRHDRYPLKVTASAGASVELLGTDDAPSPNPLAQPRLIKVHFPKGQGYQTMEFTLTW